MVLTQVCFDPDCKGFRSEPVPLPTTCTFVKDTSVEYKNDCNNFNHFAENGNVLDRNQKGLNINDNSICRSNNQKITLQEKCEKIHKLMTMDESVS